MSKILFFGDIFGKPGRQALAQVLPMWRKEYNPDVVIANVENLAHGKGVTLSTLAELDALGVDVYTSGNHIFDKDGHSQACFERYPNLIRPANYSDTFSGSGAYRFCKNGTWYCVINLGGKVFFERFEEKSGTKIGNPFFAADQVLRETAQKGDIILVDFHAEVTSEKNALGWYLDGRATVLVGTHTHVPTADMRMFPKGLAFVTDIGFTGPMDSIIGAKKESVLDVFLEKAEKFRLEPADGGPVAVNAVLIETDGNRAVKIERIKTEYSN